MKNPFFIKSVADSENYYSTDKPVVAIAGKSNVGKSSLINMLACNKKLARTSDTPGRTRLINYFDFDTFVLADLPGYGYAKVNKQEKAKWGNLMEDFLTTQKIDLIISLVDIRHDPTSDDLTMINFLYHYAMPFIIVATKADKISKSQIRNRLLKLSQVLKVGVDNIIPSSAEQGLGKKEIFSAISQSLSAK